MVTGLLDTAVLIDLIRHHPPAIAWVGLQSGLGLSWGVWLELLEGVRNKADQIRAVRLLQSFILVDVLPADFQWALEKMSLYHLSHGVGGLDCLIAAPAARLGLPLYTLNLRHFAPLLGVGAHQPY